MDLPWRSSSLQPGSLVWNRCEFLRLAAASAVGYGSRGRVTSMLRVSDGRSPVPITAEYPRICRECRRNPGQPL